MAPKKRPPPSKGADPPINKRPKTDATADESTTKTDAKPALNGAVMVFTGEMEAIPRPEAEEKAKAAGAKVTGSVSGNTTYLVMGSYLDDGRPVEATSKYRKYLDLKEKGKKCPQLLTEQEFLALLPGPGGATEANSGSSSSSSSAAKVVPEEDREVGPWTNDINTQWVDLHAPRDLAELIGNASNIKKLDEWLRDWDDVVFKGKKKAPRFKPQGGMPENINARAALISGPPGIGKTTAVNLIAQKAGSYDILEYNASDARGQKMIQSMAAGIADNRVLNFGSAKDQGAVCPQLTRRALIIMDEVDGMSAGDRGGNAALIKMIKKTKNPIICICNDSGNPKVRSLGFSCYEIKWTRPTKSLIGQRVTRIAQRMGFTIEPNAAENLAESCGNDIRMVINQLQVIVQFSALKLQNSLTYTGTKDKIQEMRKDQQVMMSPFDACKSLLTGSEARKMSMNDRIEMFFVDFSLVPLLVQENCLKAVENKTTPNLMEDCARSAELFAYGDIMNNRIRDSGEWGLLPSCAVLGAVYPAHVTNGFVPFPQFPQFLGKYSNQSKMQRLSRELHAHLRMGTTTSRRKLISSGYTDRLYKKAVRPLMNEEIEDTVRLMDAYALQRDHIAEHLSELQMHLGEDDTFKLVDAKVKAAMTRELNSGHHAPRVVLPAAKKKRGSNQVTEDPDAPKPEEDDDSKVKSKNDDDAAEEANDEKDEKIAGGLIKVRKASAKESTKASKAKARLAKTEEKLNEVPSKAKARPAKTEGKLNEVPSKAKARLAKTEEKLNEVPTTTHASTQAKEERLAKLKEKMHEARDAKMASKAKAKATNVEVATTAKAKAPDPELLPCLRNLASRVEGRRQEAASTKAEEKAKVNSKLGEKAKAEEQVKTSARAKEKAKGRR